MKKTAAILAAFLALSCGSDPAGGGVEDGDYFPHDVASYWSYDRNGTVGGQFQAHGSRLTTVTGLAATGGSDLVELTTAGTDTIFTDTLQIVTPLGGVSALRIDGYGVWTYTDTLMTDSLQLARFPLVEGDSWAASSDVEGEVVSMEETVTVPDGTFEDVLHISTTEVDTLGYQTVDDYWYAPGIGLVSHDKVMQNGSLILYELSEDLVGHLTF